VRSRRSHPIRSNLTHSDSRKTVSLRTDGTPSLKASVSALWGPKALDSIVELDLDFEVETEKAVLRRLAAHDLATYV
jgi:DNA mismatch repair protein PMS2